MTERSFIAQSLQSRPFDAVASIMPEAAVRPLEASLTDRMEAALRYVESEAQYRMFVVVEGPPIYLWPALPSHDWVSPAFINGWKMANALTGRIPAEKLRHYVLVDDMNFRPDDASKEDFERRVSSLWQSSETLRQSPIFAQLDGVKRFSETDLSAEVGSTQCSILDATFNARKVVDHMRDSGGEAFIYPENLNALLLLVVGPNGQEIKAEQLNMLQALYERLKSHPNFQRTSKENIRKAIVAMYRHVWLDGNGNPVEITKPIFANNKFMFQNTVG